MHATTATADVQHRVWAELVEHARRLDRLEDRIAGITEEERAHLRAKQRDARDFINRGDTRTLVVLDPPEDVDGTQALAKIEGVYTFIEPGRFTLRHGDTIRTKILDVGPSHAEAIALTVESSEADR